MSRRVGALTALGLSIGGMVLAGCGYQAAAPRPAGGAAAAPTATPASPTTPPAAAPVPPPPAVPTSLLDVRRGFQTRLAEQPRKPVPPPDPPLVFELIRYQSPAGPMAAYITRTTAEGGRRPALLWCHGGFDGIGDYLWEPSNPDSNQSVGPYWEAGLVVMCPSWRGENDNPGRYEMFYGEVDDLLAAAEHLARHPAVDPNRIYLAGHSNGGTLALLGAVATNRFRAVFSLSGAPDVEHVVRNGKGYGNTPYDYRSVEESRMRSAAPFVQFLRAPTFYIAPEKFVYGDDALTMQQQAAAQNKPFRALFIRGADHLSLLEATNRAIAKKIAADTGPACNIALDAGELQRAFDGRK